MTVYAKISVEGEDYRNFITCKINKTTSENNSISKLTLSVDNEIGINKSLFSEGNDIIVYVDKNINPPTTKIFGGVIDDVNYTGRGQTETINITAVDYSTLLTGATIKPITYNDNEVSVIVTNIIDNEVPDITTTNINVTSTTLTRIAFNQTNVFDALKQLAELSNSYFYVDADMDLHFISNGTTSSGETLDNTNIIKINTKNSRKPVFNKVWVYGDNVMTNITKTFIADGGSVITLNYKPHNTRINITGTELHGGGIYNMTSIPYSGERYLVDYDDKRIVFTSGTQCGLNIPTSGNAGSIWYDRAKPIVKYGENAASIGSFYGKTKIIDDKNIKDPRTAIDIVNSTLDRESAKAKEITITMDDIIDLTPGHTIIVDYSNHNISNQTYDIIKTTYNLTRKTMREDTVLSVTLNKKIVNVLDTLKQLLLDIKKIQAGDISLADSYTRLQNVEFSVTPSFFNWEITSKNIGSVWYLGSPANKNGWVGSPGSYYVTSGVRPSTIIASGTT